MLEERRPLDATRRDAADAIMATMPGVENMRRSALVTIALLVAACQANSPQSPTISGATGSRPSSGAASTSDISVSACHPGFFGQGNPAAATPAPVGSPSPATAAIPASLQGRLGAFGDSQGVVLAPVGWTCWALLDPGRAVWTLSSPDRVEEIYEEVDSADSGDALSLACPLFADALAQSQPTGAGCAPPPVGEVDQAISSELVSFTDPPGIPGTGLDSGAGLESDGLVWYHRDGLQIQASTISCMAAGSDQQLCAAILDYFTSALPAPAAGATPATLASFEPTPLPTEAATAPPIAPPVGDCAVRLTSADATVVVRGAGTSACTAAKHALLQIGVFTTVDPKVATKGLRLICSGPVAGLSSRVEVWDLGGATYATMICQGWNLVSP